MVEPAGTAAEREISFGPFHVFPKQRLLLEGDKVVRLGSRAWDILIALIERPGEPISREELMTRVWPDTVVVEGNLPVHMAALRRALGDGHDGNRYVVTIPGRGYSFAAPIKIAETPRPAPSQPAVIAHGHNLPVQLTRLIGRADIVGRLAGQLENTRLLTITGPAGIGKTSVALAVAEQLIGAYKHGVWLIDLAPLGDPLLVPSAVASVLGLEIRSENPLPGVVAALRDKQMLLVLDNCVHVIEVATSLAIAVLRGAPGIRFLVTSREPMRAQGERVSRLSALESPPAGTLPSAAEALRYPAVQLFIERATAATGEFKLSDADAPIVADICRKLDGLPLAIEFAAARVEAFGVPGLAARMDDRFRLLLGGHRTALPRHQTMAATLDWSYSLLTEAQQFVLRGLAIFAGGFTPRSAGAVIADATHPESDVIDQVTELVAKSLVAPDVSGNEPRLRLLETTRVYALEKLAASGERERLARRHAEYYHDLFEQAEAEWERRPTAEWLADYGRRIDNLRAALDWAFSPAGDAPIGVALTAAAVPLWMHMSLVDECRGRVERALAAIATGAGPDPRREMKLRAALGAALLYTRGAVPEIGEAWTAALEIAEGLDDTGQQLRALVGLFTFHLNSGRSRVALALAQRFCALAARSFDATDRLTGEQLMGVSQHLLGNQPAARHHFERIVADLATLDHRSLINRFQIDLLVWARVFLAWTLWLQGFPDQAMHTAGRSLEDARAADHALSLCFALARGACPIALLMGDLDAAEHYVEMLLDNSTRHVLAHWRAIGRGQQGVLAIRRGDPVNGVRLLRAGFDDLGNHNSVVVRLVEFLIAEALSRAGLIVDGLAAVEETLAWTKRSEEQWLIAELLRVKGDLLLLRNAPAAAEDHFRQALDQAGRQGALSWELRAATSLARLLRDQGRSAEAAALLQPVYDRFTEGFDTADPKTAKALLDALSEPAAPRTRKS